MDGQSIIQASPNTLFFDIYKWFPWILFNLKGIRDFDLLLKTSVALWAPTVSFCFFFWYQFYSFCKIGATTVIGLWLSAHLSMFQHYQLKSSNWNNEIVMIIFH